MIPVVIVMAHTSEQPICAVRAKCGRKTVLDVVGVIARGSYISRATSAAGAEKRETVILEALKITHVAGMQPIIIHTTETSNVVTKLLE